MKSPLRSALLCFCVACSSPKPEPAVPETPPEPAPEPTSAVAQTPRESSDGLRAISDRATLVVRIRGDRVRQGPIAETIDALKRSVAQARQGLAIAQAACGFDPLEAIQEIVIGAQHQHHSQPGEPLGRWNIDPDTASVAILLDRPAEDALRCIGNFVPGEASEIAGQPALALPMGSVLQARRELLIYTPRAEAQTAAERIQRAAPLAPELQATLDGNPDAVALVYARGDNPLGLSWGSLAISHPAGGLEVKAVGLAESPEAASRVSQQLVDVIARARSELTSDAAPPAAARLAEWLDRAHVEQNGTSISATLRLDEALAHELFAKVLVDLSQTGVNRYTSAAKTSEARDNIMRIALALSDYARAHPTGRRFPASAPLSPAQVPGKQRAAPSGFEHPSWRAIGYAPRDPLYYAYEFVTAKDGRSVEVIARGDLDGDGEQSSFSVTVKANGKEPEISSSIVKHHPYE